jgi:GNAT superfamily N-acetyltransferase
MKTDNIIVRNTTPDDFNQIIDLCGEVYTGTPPWTEQQLSGHLQVFPEGQIVAVDAAAHKIVGMASSLIVRWDDYDMASSWRDFTSHGTFANHDPISGRTLYGAEVMVRPDSQGMGIGSKLYEARRAIARRFNLFRIRAGARLRGYGKWVRQLTADQYVFRVIYGALRDPTLSFQLKHGFKVIGVVSNYLRHDPESLGYAAVIEWLNPLIKEGRTTKTPPLLVSRRLIAEIVA